MKTSGLARDVVAIILGITVAAILSPSLATAQTGGCSFEGVGSGSCWRDGTTPDRAEPGGLAKVYGACSLAEEGLLQGLLPEYRMAGGSLHEGAVESVSTRAESGGAR